MNNLPKLISKLITGKYISLDISRQRRCSDCHGAHNIYKMDNPNSTISPRNIVKTCQKCHEDANMKFTGYLSHATHYNKEKFPWLYYTFWGMTAFVTQCISYFLDFIHCFGFHVRLAHMIKKAKTCKN